MTKTEIPPEMVNKALKVLELAKTDGKVKRGTNEVTKVVERGTAKLVYIANDVTPPEIVAHLPLLCEEKDIACVNVPTRQELGRASGVEVPAASVVIVEEGSAKKELSKLVEQINTISKGKPAKKEEKPAEGKKETPAKKEEKPAKKEEKPAEAKKEEPKKEKPVEEKKEKPSEEKKEKPAEAKKE